MLTFIDEKLVAIHRQEREAEAAKARLVREIQSKQSFSLSLTLKAMLNRFTAGKPVQTDMKRTTSTMRIVTQE